MNSSSAPTIDIAAIAGELAQVQEGIRRLTDREKQLKAELRGVLPLGKHLAGNLSVSVSPNRRIDEAKVATTYPQDQWPGFWIAKPATTVIRNSIPPAVYEQLMSEVGEPKITVS